MGHKTRDEGDERVTNLTKRQKEISLSRPCRFVIHFTCGLFLFHFVYPC